MKKVVLFCNISLYKSKIIWLSLIGELFCLLQEQVSNINKTANIKQSFFTVITSLPVNKI
jgi:uncharacterized membrane protein